MTPTYDIAVVGATGLVGSVILEILEERKFPVNKIYPLASEKSAGTNLRFGGHSAIVHDVADFDFSKVQIAFFSAGGKVSEKYVPKAAAAGCISIDNTSHFRYDEDVPLIIPEVNPEAILQYYKRKIIANPNCSTIQMLVALKPIYDAVGISRIDVATYQAVSGAGRSAVDELARETTELMNAQNAVPKVFPAQIAFNVIPQVDVILENGYTKEEMKMVWETHKILNDSSIVVNPTAVRVPVFFGHSEAVHIETKKSITPENALKLLRKAPGVKVIKPEKGYPMAFTHGANSDFVFVGRVRQNPSHPQHLNLWVVADNIRKGAALNAIQIAENLIENNFYLDEIDELAR